MYELIAKLVCDGMNNYRCIKKEYSGTPNLTHEIDKKNNHHDSNLPNA